ncbi:MAG: DUF167 domain-containing protein [Bacillota bacterium]
MSAKVRVHAKPGAKRCQLAWDGESLTAWLTAPPVEGKANRQLLELLKEVLGVSLKHLTIVSGGSSKHKVVEVVGLSQDELNEILAARVATIGDNGS